MKNNLVIYYSWLGHTKVVAEEIARWVDGDVLRIEEAKERKEGKGFGSAAMGALFGLGSKLKPVEYGFAGYSNIFLGAQVWASHSTPPINTFLKKADFTGKKVYLFITKADEKVPQEVIDSLSKRIAAKGGEVVDTLSITTRINQPIQPEDVRPRVEEWVNGLHLNN
ncbi:MAG: hypothetical protein QHH06_13835 [Clostridiales bacterium]|nr:hypothetical protein [Eubacteriales bacterium]MDH7567523.1 hypothetical protein [Clostridiales bacterium]